MPGILIDEPLLIAVHVVQVKPLETNRSILRQPVRMLRDTVRDAYAVPHILPAQARRCAVECPWRIKIRKRISIQAGLPPFMVGGLRGFLPRRCE